MAADVTGGRFGLASPTTATVLAVLGAALLIAAVPLTTVNHTPADPRGGAIIPVIIACGAVGRKRAGTERQCRSGNSFRKPLGNRSPCSRLESDLGLPRRFGRHAPPLA